MLPAIQVPVGVSIQNCLSWSPDGELAIAAGEEVYLLLPHNEGREPCTHVRFRVNAFTHDEWPVRPQASFADMSIGEEQGRVTIASLGWSPSGLAKHRRSVLAILTTNLILSLWASPNPKHPGSWRRVCIVNNVAIPQGLASKPAIRSVERVRSMAWVPPNDDHADGEVPLSTRKWGLPLLAVADDSNGLCILTVHSPSSCAIDFWDIEVLAYNDVHSIPQRTTRPSLLSEALHPKHFIDHVFFDDWSSNGELAVTMLASGTVYQTALTVSLTPAVAVSMADIHLNQADDGKPRALPRSALGAVKASMTEHQTKYSKDNHHNIHNVIMKTWGADRWGSLCAACVTCHPAKMVEYQAVAEDSATILFGNAGDEDASQTLVSFPWQTPPNINLPKARQTIVSSILSFSSTSQTSEQPLKLTRFDIKIIYTAIVAQVMLKLKALQPLSNIKDLETALLILEQRSGAQLQLERALIASLQRSLEDIERLLNEWAMERSSNGFDFMTPGLQLLDICPFCVDDELGLAGGLNEVTGAYCPKMHSFARCALTFLPILEPGCSKYCSKCKREFINEELHPEISLFQGEQTSENDHAKPSLATMLFAKFDVCPYCDGKFCA